MNRREIAKELIKRGNKELAREVLALRETVLSSDEEKLKKAIEDQKGKKEIYVSGHLNLSRTGITELPEGLRVGGSLYLSYTQVKELPTGLRVGGDLDLGGTKVKELPPDLEVKGEIYKDF